jgi:hypothetical protein
MNTLEQLRARGIIDPHLEAMAEMVAARQAA